MNRFLSAFLLPVLLCSSAYGQELLYSDYHEIRGGISNSKLQFESGEGRVAFLGGSITYNPGWRDSVMNYLSIRFPNTEFEFIKAGIPSMGSTPGAFRLERDILSQGRIDLLFMEAAVNDATNGRTRQEQIRAEEGIILHSLHSNPYMDIIMMHFVDPDKMQDYNSGREPDVIRNHNSVAAHYNIPVINLAKEVTERINNGEFTWEDDFKDLHPSPFGQGVYARSITSFLKNAYDVTGNELSERQLPDMLDPYSYDGGVLVEAVNVKATEGWTIDSSWKPDDGKGTREGYVNVPMLVGTDPGGILKFKFKGNAVGIAIAAGPDAGIIEYRIDKGEWQRQDLFTRWSSFLHLPWYYTLASGLSSKRHLLELRISPEKNEASAGTSCRIRYFYVNE